MELLLTAIVSAIVSALVAWAFAYRMADRDEAGRQDRTARMEIARHLRVVRARLMQEAGRRQAKRDSQGGMIVRRPEFTIYEWQDLVWPVLDAIGDPALNRKTAEQVEIRFRELMGDQQVQYLNSLSEAPGRPVTMSEVTERIKESGMLDQGLDTPVMPVDRMFQSDDPKLVSDMVTRIDGITSLVLPPTLGGWLSGRISWRRSGRTGTYEVEEAKMADASARLHRERVGRGAIVVDAYLREQFPGYVVETLQPSSRDIERSARTFVVRKDKERYLLRASDEVLDLDAEGTRSHLQRLGVARALREDVGAGQVLLVELSGIRIES